MHKNLEPSWKKALTNEFNQPYFIRLADEIKNAYLKKSVFPSAENIFKAFDLCPITKVKVVILGQDPYHGEGQAQGLSFSVPNDVKIPPSLKNIYIEILNDIGTPIPENGNLEKWAKQGVLLLNATLTVLPKKPGSHQGLGWEIFTDAVIQKISSEKEHVVFLLWGKYAGTKASLVDQNKHLVLTAPHPSPFSSYTGFFGCKHFSKTNEYLKKNGLGEIRW